MSLHALLLRATYEQGTGDPHFRRTVNHLKPLWPSVCTHEIDS